MFINILDMKTRLAGIENAWASVERHIDRNRYQRIMEIGAATGISSLHGRVRTHENRLTPHRFRTNARDGIVVLTPKPSVV